MVTLPDRVFALSPDSRRILPPSAAFPVPPVMLKRPPASTPDPEVSRKLPPEPPSDDPLFKSSIAPSKPPDKPAAMSMSPACIASPVCIETYPLFFTDFPVFSNILPLSNSFSLVSSLDMIKLEVEL